MKEFSAYPIPTGPYKVHVNDGEWRPYNAARLQISMNNPKHTGDKFWSQAEWVSARFERVELIISDTLYRYNIMTSHGVDEPTARRLALQIGDRWLEDNSKAISMIRNKTITRWNDWTSDTKFKSYEAQVRRAHDNDPTFKAAIDETIIFFLKKREGLTDDNRPYYSELSRNYLIEEIAAFGIMHEKDHMIDIRPGSPLKPVLDLLASGAVNDVPEGCKKINSILIDYTKNKSYA